MPNIKYSKSEESEAELKLQHSKLRSLEDRLRRDHALLQNDPQARDMFMVELQNSFTAVQTSDYSRLSSSNSMMDIKLLFKLVQMLRKAIQEKKSRFCLAEFAEILTTEMRGEMRDDGRASVKYTSWAKLGKRINSSFKSTPALTYLNGAMVEPGDNLSTSSASTRNRRARASQVLSQAGYGDNRETRVVDLTNETPGPASSFDEDIKKVLKFLEGACLKQRRQLDLYEFALDPKDFSTSVRNLFFISFLVKDGSVSMKVVDDIPYICPTSLVSKFGIDGEEPEPFERSTGGRGQTTLSITKQNWEDMIEALGIKTAIINL